MYMRIRSPTNGGNLTEQRSGETQKTSHSMKKRRSKIAEIRAWNLNKIPALLSFGFCLKNDYEQKQLFGDFGNVYPGVP